MIDRVTINDFRDVQIQFGLPKAALVEKDLYVVRAIAAIAAANTAPFRLVFGGGTSLSRAHGVIRRMSEDIDLKIVGDREPTRPELRRLRDTITKALLTAGFCFDPANRTHRDSRNESRYTIFRLPYEPLLRGDGVLRPEIQIEVAVWPLRRASVNLPVCSFVAEAFGHSPEVASIPCVAITQTAAEKFVALTRRIAAELADTSNPRDATLVRHIYDLHVIRPHYDPAEVAALALSIMPHDADVFGNQFPPYRDDPLAETMRAVSALQTDGGYAQRYAHFLRDMVYGEKIVFAVCLDTLNKLAGHLVKI
ncbi:MAG: nucleotidyl transferase AbiEii/AbiGii toxin family protein [Magnetococcales bacterium]|nr:nucleotidyl transferase AbiEii/AbiGii toxin family protein [Magnetococcales bacterium]